MFKNQQTEPIVQVKNLTKLFSNRKVLENITFEVYHNEILLIIGFSGAGKSTLLRLICGLEEPDSGEVILKTDHLSMVFQGSALFDSMTVFDNVAFPLINSIRKISYNELKQKVLEKLKLVGLAGVEHLGPDELSGGMKKRVSFARAIINDPQIILYDEPTGGLDPVASTVIINYILKLQQELNTSSVLVSHNLDIIQKIQSRVILLYDSKIVWQGNSKDLFTTSDPFALQFREGNLEGPMAVIRE